MSRKPFRKLPEIFQNDEVQPYLSILQKRRATLFVKRLLDIAVSGFMMIVLSPVIIITSIVVAVSSKGPVFYRQTRVGRLNRDFTVYKFRTMEPGADRTGPLTVGERDPRITPVGRFLRKWRIDELPQLFNVLFGDMSMIGARPEVRKFVDCYKPEMMASLLLRPGLSCAASLAFRGENKMLADKEDPGRFYTDEILPAKMRMNLDYQKNIRLMTDIRLMIKTVVCVLNAGDGFLARC